MPYANPSELPAPVRNALPAHGQAYKKDQESGECVRLTNIEPVCSEPGGITSFHDVRLQRLDVFMDYAGMKVRHTREHFNNAAVWERIPVIFQKTGAGVPGVHPDFDAVATGTLDPEKYVNVGHIENPHIAPAGEPSLVGRVAFTNPACSLLAKTYELSLSTGFAAPTRLLDDGRKEIAGPVEPNHVLIFRRGSCPNCYPNDNGAQFLNMPPASGDDEMDEESKGILNEVREYLANLTKKPPAVPAERTMEDKLTNQEETVESLKAEIAALKKKIAELEGDGGKMTNLVAQYKTANAEAKTAFENLLAENKDLKWTLLKNALPAAWVDTEEHTRAAREKFENTPHIFAAELAAIKAQVPADKPAEGDKMTNTLPAEEDGYGVITGPKMGGKKE